MPKILALLFFTLASFVSPPATQGQQTRAAQQAPASSTLSGLVTDPTGAVIPGASITLHPRDGGPAIHVVSGADGSYTLTAPAGVAGTLDVSAQGFAPYIAPKVELFSTRARTLNIHLIIATQTEQVEVSGDTADPTDPNNNGDAIILKGRDIDELPTDPQLLQQQLQALSGGQTPDFYVDGFSGGTLPSKDTIREIRINQNPYSAMNDTNPVNGRIEIFTKPGSGKVHGDLFIYGDDSALDSGNPFARDLPPYYAFSANGSVSGPINKRSGYAVGFAQRNFESSNVVNAQILDANLNSVGLQQTSPTSTTFSNLNVRYDAAIRKSSTLTVSYNVQSNPVLGGGVGQLNLASQGSNTYATTQTLQLSNSQIASPKIVNDTRFQYIRSRNHTTPLSLVPTISVEGAFNGGGSPGGAGRDNLDRYELQNYVTASEGKQYMTFGGRLRVFRDANVSEAGYNGSYIFPTLSAYQITLQGLAAALTPAQIRANGGGASEFTLASGTPAVKVALADVGLFFQDDVKVRKNLTLSAGLRFESQTAISDHVDPAPRLGLSWAPYSAKKKPGPYTVRGGAGIFYNRFAYGSLSTAVRQNGVTQQEFIVQNPDFYPTIPAPSALAAVAPSSVTEISSRFHAPYSLVATAAVDRRFGSVGTLSLSYVVNRGVHTQLEDNVNAPLNGVRPLGGTQDVYQFQSEGVLNAKRLNLNVNLHAKKFFFYGFYQLQSQHSDSDGGFPSNQYDIGADYGRSSNDRLNSVGMGGNMPLPFGFSSYAFVNAASGPPFNITVGQDLNGDSQFNDRPAFATDLTRASVVRTAYGNFDTAPIAGQTIIPRNYGQAPGYFFLYLSLDRSIEFGPVLKAPPGAVAPKLKPGIKPPKPERKYNLHFSINVQNATNHVNLAAPIGVLSSPLFGHSISLTNSVGGNREIALQTYFHF